MFTKTLEDDILARGEVVDYDELARIFVNYGFSASAGTLEKLKQKANDWHAIISKHAEFDSVLYGRMLFATHWVNLVWAILSWRNAAKKLGLDLGIGLAYEDDLLDKMMRLYAVELDAESFHQSEFWGSIPGGFNEVTEAEMREFCGSHAANVGPFMVSFALFGFYLSWAFISEDSKIYEYENLSWWWETFRQQYREVYGAQVESVTVKTTLRAWSKRHMFEVLVECYDKNYVPTTFNIMNAMFYNDSRIMSRLVKERDFVGACLRCRNIDEKVTFIMMALLRIAFSHLQAGLEEEFFYDFYAIELGTAMEKFLSWYNFSERPHSLRVVADILVGLQPFDLSAQS